MSDEIFAHLEILISSEAVVTKEVHLPAYMSIIRLHWNSKDSPFPQHIGCVLDDPGLVHFDFDEGFLFCTVAVNGVLVMNLGIVHKLYVLTEQLILNLW